MRIEYSVSTMSAEHHQNEDAGAAFEGQLASGWRAAICVADGLGSLCDSAAVSREATSTPPLDRDAELTHAVIAWSQAANASIGLRFDSAKVGTTFACMLISEDSYALASVGDCRAYRVRGQTVDLLTTDDTRLSQMLGRTPTRVEAKEGGDPARHLTKWLDGTAREDEYYNVSGGPVVGDEVFVLASDGLWTELEPTELLPLAADGPLQKALDDLVLRAWLLDPTDDVTCAAIRLRAS